MGELNSYLPEACLVGRSATEYFQEIVKELENCVGVLPACMEELIDGTVLEAFNQVHKLLDGESPNESKFVSLEVKAGGPQPDFTLLEIFKILHKVIKMPEGLTLLTERAGLLCQLILTLAGLRSLTLNLSVLCKAADALVSAMFLEHYVRGNGGRRGAYIKAAMEALNSLHTKYQHLSMSTDHMVTETFQSTGPVRSFQLQLQAQDVLQQVQTFTSRDMQTISCLS